jgi:hypothetical protein
MGMDSLNDSYVILSRIRTSSGPCGGYCITSGIMNDTKKKRRRRRKEHASDYVIRVHTALSATTGLFLEIKSTHIWLHGLSWLGVVMNNTFGG